MTENKIYFSFIIIVLAAFIFVTTSCDSKYTPERWKEIATIKSGKTHVIPSTWPDKYPDMPMMTPGAIITIIDQDGPGVVTNIHSSAYILKYSEWTPSEAESLRIRVWYDNNPTPAIEMPFMDFLADVQGKSTYFSTIYFSKVKQSHNFRLPMPFRRHIKINVENLSDKLLHGYMDVQWDKVDKIDDDCGYLMADFKTGIMDMADDASATLWDIQSAGTVVAHWLQLEADDPCCADGQFICEANQEIYLDNDNKPSIEYLGTEDVYGFSWGFHGIQSDFFAAILKWDALPKGGTRVAMLRARDLDRITYNHSCELILTYRYDKGVVEKAKAQNGIPVQYRSCVYYYTKK